MKLILENSDIVTAIKNHVAKMGFDPSAISVAVLNNGKALKKLVANVEICEGDSCVEKQLDLVLENADVVIEPVTVEDTPDEITEVVEVTEPEAQPLAEVKGPSDEDSMFN
ncbi:MAG: hypothetical protein HRU18_02955 [Pseudoalteromonas sp.]|uniref:hypothetical protein n=1 Tax=Pseudoalteromonas sp. TaxID=53249 RepID=UPI001D66E4E3|nr:hypothetical protein [Pseudoalteromonas sp.]NRA77144.1 hypothetical protein [Pseudoalteromonas sp.]